MTIFTGITMRRRNVLGILGTGVAGAGPLTRVAVASEQRDDVAATGGPNYRLSDPAEYYASAIDRPGGTDYEWTWNGAAPGGRKATVWVHGWNAGWMVGDSFRRWVTGNGPADENRASVDLAFDAIVNEAGYTDTGDRIGFVWDSASSKAGFHNAVLSMWDTSTNFARFLVELCEAYDEVHVGAHSLGGWLTLEGLSATMESALVSYGERRRVADSLASIRMTNAAVPSSATGWDADWTRFGTYDRALHLPGEIINGFYIDDEVLSATGLVDLPLPEIGSSPFQSYLANYGSSSPALGWLPKTAHLCEDDGIDWEDRQVCAEDHSNAYKHPDYGNLPLADPAGGAQPVIWKNAPCDAPTYGPRCGIGRGSSSSDCDTTDYLGSRMCLSRSRRGSDRERRSDDDRSSRDGGRDDDGRDRRDGGRVDGGGRDDDRSRQR